jgi:MYXO-CTERM domain-containing protein
VYPRFLSRPNHPVRRGLGLLLVLGSGCGAETYGDDWAELSSVEQAIISGEPSPESEDGVLHLEGGSGNEHSSCTATLIAPDVIVTALHCVAQFTQDDEFSCTPDGTLATPPPDGVLGATFAPETILLRVGAQRKAEVDAYGVKVFRSGATDICKQDIALVVLDRQLDLPIAKVRLRQRTERGERVRVVGYGSTGLGTVDRFTRSGVRVTDVGEDQTSEVEGFAPPYTFVVTEGPCQGDSGGPAFSEETGALLGVYSISAGLDCSALGVRNMYTALAPFEPLVLEALDYAGREPLLEAAPVEDAGASADEVVDEPKTVEDIGSGSRQDPSCLCHVSPSGAPRGAFVSALAAIALVLHRRRTKGPLSTSR